MCAQHDVATNVPDFNKAITANLPFEETMAVLKRAIVEERFLLIHEIPVQSILATHDITISATKQLLFFHPRYMLRILSGNPRAIIEAPLKLVVREVTPETTLVSYILPSYLFGRYEGLETLGTELEEVITRLVSVLPLSHA